MQLEGHGSYWKAKILKIQEIQFFVAVIEKKRFFWPELPRVTLPLFQNSNPDLVGR